MKRISVLLAVLAILMIGVVPVASATPPQSVWIDTTLEGPLGGDFTSNIPGCEAGTWTDEFLQANGNWEKLIVNVKVEKTLFCDGSDDEIVIRFLPKVRGVLFPQTGHWKVVGGMINGERVRGNGWMTAFGDGPFGYLIGEEFTGKIHIG